MNILKKSIRFAAYGLCFALGAASTYGAEKESQKDFVNEKNRIISQFVDDLGKSKFQQAPETNIRESSGDKTPVSSDNKFVAQQIKGARINEGEAAARVGQHGSVVKLESQWQSQMRTIPVYGYYSMQYKYVPIESKRPEKASVLQPEKEPIILRESSLPEETPLLKLKKEPFIPQAFSVRVATKGVTSQGGIIETDGLKMVIPKDAVKNETRFSIKKAAAVQRLFCGAT